MKFIFIEQSFIHCETYSYMYDEFHTCQCVKRCFGMNIILRCMNFITHFFLMSKGRNSGTPCGRQGIIPSLCLSTALHFRIMIPITTRVPLIVSSDPSDSRKVRPLYRLQSVCYCLRCICVHEWRRTCVCVVAREPHTRWCTSVAEASTKCVGVMGVG